VFFINILHFSGVDNALALSLGGPECENNIKMDLSKIEWDGMNWINLA
jgi:hypothetical protein